MINILLLIAYYDLTTQSNILIYSLQCYIDVMAQNVLLCCTFCTNCSYFLLHRASEIKIYYRDNNIEILNNMRENPLNHFLRMQLLLLSRFLIRRLSFLTNTRTKIFSQYFFSAFKMSSSEHFSENMDQWANEWINGWSDIGIDIQKDGWVDR